MRRISWRIPKMKKFMKGQPLGDHCTYGTGLGPDLPFHIYGLVQDGLVAIAVPEPASVLTFPP